MAPADITPYGTVLSIWHGAIDDRPGRAGGDHEHDRPFPDRPEPGDVIAEGRILKLGRRLAVGEVVLRSGGDPRPLCDVALRHPPELG
jgi:hypothetical protein